MGKTKELFKERVRRLRKSLDFTQPELAKKAGVSIQTIKDLESGKSPGEIDTHKGLSKAFGISIDELLEGEMPEPNKVIVRLPPTDTLKIYLKIPNDVVELISRASLSEQVWNDIRDALEAALPEQEAGEKPA
jgi:transcriptional regulator with XRE-family HTH domain